MSWVRLRITCGAGVVAGALACARAGGAETIPAERPPAIATPVASAAQAGGQGVAAAQPEAPLTLRACYALALARSETIAIQEELIRETEGRFLQALSGALPRTSFALSERRQDATNDSSFRLKKAPERKITFSQPLFSGLKEFAAMAGSRAERRQRIQEKARAEQLLLIDVADAFYLLVEQRQELEALEGVRTALLRRIEELEERARLGRSRASEVVSAEAQLRRVEADFELARGQEDTARHLLEFLTGREPIAAIADDMAVPPLEHEERYLARVSLRPNVRAAEEAWTIAKKEVAVARAKFWPTASVEGNYYVERVGVSEGIDWDMLFKLDVPIFQGGQALGAVQEALSKARQARWRAEQARRGAVLEVKDAYVKLQAAMARREAFEKALEATEEDFRLQEAEYQLSLVSNLDVLRALQALGDARRNAIHARYDVKRLYWQLRAATGQTL